ncbi:MAG: metal-dependent transcriptional regulator [Saprospiraceae bacterium]|nr:metal-dependent transcriptional regulator [Saprospiraceae bacterium]
MATQTEEDYIKAIFKITERNQGAANTNAIAKYLNTSAASVTDMLKRLSDKDYFHYEKYKGVYLTSKGIQMATQLVRKHRLWEVFLAKKLDFSWEEVHDIAEQLEHIKSDTLIEKLDAFLGHPKYDPHGDPIPNAEGKFTLRNQFGLSTLSKGEKGIVVGVKEHDKDFLQYLNQLEIGLGTEVEVIDVVDFDHSIKLKINNQEATSLSYKVTKNIYIKKQA